MTTECTVVIAPADLMGALTERLRATSGELVTCPDSDIARAIETVVERKPTRVALERLFAATSRGAALLTRLKADPALVDIEIRIVSHDSDYSRVSPRKAPPQAQPLDQRGTRRAPRFKMGLKALASVDTVKATLMDLSTIGAQLVTTLALKPGQQVKMTLDDKDGNVRFTAAVMWASFEIPPSGVPRYRGGLEFSEADVAAVDAFIARHRL